MKVYYICLVKRNQIKNRYRSLLPVRLVIKYYWNCPILIRSRGFCEINRAKSLFTHYNESSNIWVDEWEELELDEITLILRPFSDITDQERIEYKDLTKRELEKNTNGYYTLMTSVDTPESFLYLLSHYFDIFDLLPRKLAITMPHALNIVKLHKNDKNI